MSRQWGGSGGSISSSGPLGCLLMCKYMCCLYASLGWRPLNLPQGLTLSTVSYWGPHVEFLASCCPRVQPGKYLTASSSSPQCVGILPVASQPLTPTCLGFPNLFLSGTRARGHEDVLHVNACSPSLLACPKGWSHPGSAHMHILCSPPWHSRSWDHLAALLSCSGSALVPEEQSCQCCR